MITVILDHHYMLDADNHIMNSVYVPNSLLSFTLHTMYWRMKKEMK